MAKKTFYIVSDKIQTKAKDKKRMNQIASAFQSLGHNTVVGERDSNAHNTPRKYKKSMGVNDVWVCIFGGVDIEVFADHTGYKTSNWFSKEIKKGKIMYIFMSKPEGGATNIATAKKIGLAHDGKRNIPNLKSITNPANFLKKHGITWIQAGTTDSIVNKIRHKQFEGAGLVLDETSGSDSVSTTENKYTIKHGYNDSEHFEGYLKVDFTIDDSNIEKSIVIDFCTEAPDGKYSFDIDSGLIWSNNKYYTNEINLLEKIQASYGKNHKYYLLRVSIVRNFEHKKDDKSTTDVDETKLYDIKTEDSTYKMNIFNLKIFSGEVMNPSSLGVSGKTLLDSVKDILGQTEYNYDIVYNRYRDMDRINFSPILGKTEIEETFNEGFDGNIIGISDVKYSPTSDLVNNSIILYKSKLSENSEVSRYRYARRSKLNELLRYGEQTHLESMNEDETGFKDASQEAYDNLQKYYKNDITFSCTVEGLPPVKVNDYIATKTVNPILTNEYQVASRKINIDVNNRPIIQTTYGLGDISNELKVKNNLIAQRRALVKTALDLNEPVQYVDSFDGVWD